MAMVDRRLLNSRGEARVKGQCSRAVLACFSLIAFMNHIRSGSWVTFERNVLTLVHKIPLPSGYCALPALSPTPTHPVIRDNKISTDIVYKYFLPLMYPSWDIRVQGWKFIKLARITQESNKPVCLAANWKKNLVHVNLTNYSRPILPINGSWMNVIDGIGVANPFQNEWIMYFYSLKYSWWMCVDSSLNWALSQ